MLNRSRRQRQREGGRPKDPGRLAPKFPWGSSPRGESVPPLTECSEPRHGRRGVFIRLFWPLGGDTFFQLHPAHPFWVLRVVDDVIRLVTCFAVGCEAMKCDEMA